MKNDLAVAEQVAGQIQTIDAIGDPSTFLFDVGRMQALMAFAEMMGRAVVTVPKHLHGKPADCLAITMQAMRWRMDPFIVASKTHVVNGNLGYEAQLVNAVVQQSNAIRGAFSYEFKGEGNALECRVGAVLRGEEAVTWGEWLRSDQVTTKNSPLWKVNPKQQLGYLQVKNWARLYTPGAILGVYTPDELDSIAPPPANKNMGPADVVQPPAAPAKPGLPDYSDADFDKNLPAWAKVVESGKKTAADLLAMLSTKAAFSESQREQVLSLGIATSNAQVVDPFVAELEAAEVDEQ